jgi:hypothetical protein
MGIGRFLDSLLDELLVTEFMMSQKRHFWRFDRDQIWSKVKAMKQIQTSVDIGGRASGFGAAYFFGFWWYSPQTP